MFDQGCTLACRMLALGALAGAVALGIGEFVDWLQTGSWRSDSLLGAAYDAGLVSARWFLDRPWSWTLHDWLDAIPVTLGLLLAAPLFWWAANRLGRR